MAEKEVKKAPKAKSKKKLKATLFSIQGDRAERKNKSCPKCGAGIYMGAHKDRTSCGKCGFTEWKP